MGSWKRETELDAAGLPELLRRLAAALEGAGPEGVLAGLPVDGLRKLVLVAEDEDGTWGVKLKAKLAGEVRVRKADPQDQPAPKPAAKAAPRLTPEKARARDKYRQLKKTMQADYKAMKRAAEAGTLPPRDVLDSFLALCEGMADMEQPTADASALAELSRANAAFVEDARALRAALSARDAAALAEVLGRLERRKSACHAQFR